MKDHFEKFREFLKDGGKRHIPYREHYWEYQTKNIFRISVAFFMFTLVALFALVPIEHADNLYLGWIKYGVGVIGTFIFAVLSRLLLDTKKYTNSEKAAKMEIMTFVMGNIYLLWGVLGLGISLEQGYKPNVLIFLIMLAVLTAFYILPAHHYLFMVVVSYTVAGVVMHKHNDNIIDPTSMICAVVMMAMLVRLGYFRYVDGRNRFETELENQKLLNDIEAQNEELIAGNQELLAINQELNETTEKLSKAYDDIQNALDTQKRFTSIMNHELRAPLNGIIGNLQVMLMDDNLPEAQKENARDCLTLSKSLLNIVNELLDVAKIDAGQLEIFPGAFDFHHVVQNIKTMFGKQAQEKGLELKYDIDDDMICGLYGDDYRIQQVVNNLVSNGIKYTAEGSVTLGASYIKDAKILRITVADTGQGMSKEALKDLFVPFKRINESKNKKIQGTGLGMTIVESLIKAMDGAINVESQEGKGTTFTVTIPSDVIDADIIWKTTEADAQTVAENSSEQARDDQEKMFSGIKILYVDDTHLNLKIVGKLLADTGAGLDTFGDSYKGYEQALNNAYDIILVDHQMPGMDGIEFLENLRKNGDINKNTPVIVFTGNATSDASEMYAEAGFAGYITKPVLRDDLIDIIKKNI